MGNSGKRFYLLDKALFFGGVKTVGRIKFYSAFGISFSFPMAFFKSYFDLTVERFAWSLSTEIYFLYIMSIVMGFFFLNYLVLFTFFYL